MTLNNIATGSSGWLTRHSPAPFIPKTYGAGSTLRRFWMSTYEDSVTAKSCGAASHASNLCVVGALGSRQSAVHS